MNNEARATHLKNQIDLRREILQEWLKSGVPGHCKLPKSLNGVRTWSDQDLGIVAIGSPSSFTTTHRTHGQSICEISGLLTELNAVARKPPTTSHKKLLRKARAEAKQYQDSLVKSANRYASLAMELSESKRALRIARQSNGVLEQELSDAKATIASLRAKLSLLQNRGSNPKVTNINFGAVPND